jgi:hypothetical protein
MTAMTPYVHLAGSDADPFVHDTQPPSSTSKIARPPAPVPVLAESVGPARSYRGAAFEIDNTVGPSRAPVVLGGLLLALLAPVLYLAPVVPALIVSVIAIVAVAAITRKKVRK